MKRRNTQSLIITSKGQYPVAPPCIDQMPENFHDNLKSIIEDAKEMEFTHKAIHT